MSWPDVPSLTRKAGCSCYLLFQLVVQHSVGSMTFWVFLVLRWDGPWKWECSLRRGCQVPLEGALLVWPVHEGTCFPTSDCDPKLWVFHFVSSFTCDFSVLKNHSWKEKEGYSRFCNSRTLLNRMHRHIVEGSSLMRQRCQEMAEPGLRPAAWSRLCPDPCCVPTSPGGHATIAQV